MKQGLTTSPELKLLLTQYVSVEIPFGGSEFGEIFREIVRKDSSIPQAIGAPSVFVFTAKGETVYAGPDRPTGIAADDELKQLLITGIQKNGGLGGGQGGRSAAARRALTADLSRARSLLRADKPLLAAEVLAKHLPDTPEQDEGSPAADEAAGDGEQLDPQQQQTLAELVGTPVEKPKEEQQLDELVAQVTQEATDLIAAALAMVEGDKATVGAVRLAELQRVFGEYPQVQPALEQAWNDLEAKSPIEDLAEQARLVDVARQADAQNRTSAALEAYQAVVAAYPGSEAAALSQQRITQLTAKTSSAPRRWTSANGNFTVTARLESFDGQTVQLKTSDGRDVDVPLEALSKEDQEFLESTRKPQ